jgi:hypothetical protein
MYIIRPTSQNVGKHTHTHTHTHTLLGGKVRFTTSEYGKRFLTPGKNAGDVSNEDEKIIGITFYLKKTLIFRVQKICTKNKQGTV